MENKYINAKDLLNEAYAETVEGRIFDGNTYVGTFNVVPIGDITEIVNHMPSADVVEVVRCKNCKRRIGNIQEYRDMDDNPVFFLKCKGCQTDGRDYIKLVRPDGFCNEGVKDDESADSV